jgi:hypothetical protein
MHPTDQVGKPGGPHGFYLVAGMAAVLLIRVANRAPAVITGLILVIIIIEFRFLEFSTMAVAQGLIDMFAWRALLVARPGLRVPALPGPSQPARRPTAGIRGVRTVPRWSPS